MKRTLLTIDPLTFPAEYRPLLSGAPVYDSSCSPAARVYYIDRDGGYYLKTQPVAKGSLRLEAERAASSLRRAWARRCFPTPPWGSPIGF